MLVIPAVDIKDGRCVRLVEGREGTETTFGDDPAEWARRWVKEGADYLHVVDLDGAFHGLPRNFDKVAEIIDEAGAPVEFGGGVRETRVVAALVDAGADRVIIGSALVDTWEWAELTFQAFPGQIAVGIDAREGKVAIHGWTQQTERDAVDLARECERAGAAAVIYTDISRDGRMEGANLEAMADMVSATSLPVIASGGVTTTEDVELLARAGCHGCIIGRALYERRITLPAALEAARGAKSDG